MLPDPCRHLRDGRLRRGNIAQRVEHEVMDRSVVPDRIDLHAGLLELAGISLALIAQRIVLWGDDQSLGQPLQLVRAGAQRRDIGVVAGGLVRSVYIPAILHERTSEEATGAVFAVGLGIDAGVGRWDQ